MIGLLPPSLAKTIHFPLGDQDGLHSYVASCVIRRRCEPSAFITNRSVLPPPLSPSKTIQ